MFTTDTESEPMLTLLRTACTGGSLRSAHRKKERSTAGTASPIQGQSPSLSSVVHSKYNSAIRKGLLFSGGYRFEVDKDGEDGVLKSQYFIAGGLEKKTCFWTFSSFTPENSKTSPSPPIKPQSAQAPPATSARPTKRPVIRETNSEYIKKGLDPFLNPEPALTVGPIGNSHILILNKYCVLPRQLLLVTNGFQPQDEPLTYMDFWALAETLKELRKDKGPEQIVFYNCGRASGASQAHKHIQIVERPQELKKLFPEEIKMELGSKTPYSHPSIPFEHFILPIPSSSNNTTFPKILHSTFTTLLSSCSAAFLRANPQSTKTNTNFNLVMTSTFMILVPRLLPCYKDIGANSLSMVGIIWVKDDEEAMQWREEGLGNILTRVGIQRERKEIGDGLRGLLKRGVSELDPDSISIMSASSGENSSGVESD